MRSGHRPDSRANWNSLLKRALRGFALGGCRLWVLLLYPTLDHLTGGK